ncbi:hypothetical protein SH668x_002583 [Planctomicrobium sp. SH668]|uniref:hypothetical protein n=1 Tax=Planctomicrobium sp. SH668 TaxID=3448126 RepID=UPI003F5B0375
MLNAGQKKEQGATPIGADPAFVLQQGKPATGATKSNNAAAKERFLFEYEKDVPMPDLSTGNPAEVWDKLFSTRKPSPNQVSFWVMKLHQDKQYPQVIACLQAAMLHGQAQPWMYEVLALNMEIENYPKESIERVVLSLSDFGEADYSTMMYSGAYLNRFGRKEAALALYHQASRLLPERSEPYVLGLKLATQTGNVDEIQWAAEGILLNHWQPDYAKEHKLADAALKDAIGRASKANDHELVKRLEQSWKEAKSRDLSIRLEWNGEADLDMEVEEPTGAVCSIQHLETVTGGIFLHDGIGPDSKDCYEAYVCPRGIAGTYRVRVKNSGGTLVGNRATLTVVFREGMPDQSRVVRTLVIEDDEVMLTFDLAEGRRTTPRHVTILTERNPSDTLSALQAASEPVQLRQRDPRAAEVARQFRESRQGMQLNRARGGNVGFQPIIQTAGTGSEMTGQAVISADRRYVRLGINATTENLVDVFTFSYLNGWQQ